MRDNQRIEFSPLFNKQRQEAPLEVKTAFMDTFTLFLTEPYHPSLRNHSLRNRYAGFRSIDVTGDWRALYRVEHDRIFFVELGTHQQLYG